jgi:hypothetical protein
MQQVEEEKTLIAYLTHITKQKGRIAMKLWWEKLSKYSDKPWIWIIYIALITLIGVLRK